ncbi:uncharacterized protein BDW43DRAFT_316602 [Aspergillus alliaceus]|uniref:uncharacterized protein n=1 Tax=Petromyces alliaceus TaxID=209559 RepID=UPI0012A56AF5|nr:uncharacterized protein BDW43DRAFT_316602 [Aspergillus alliaceus]KAB8227698.1 hypothetical protein BDW43DRAFT_316602 [Aspergillus alliaceus]
MEGGLSSSLALPVEVSRSTLRYLKWAERVLVGWAFWVLVIYAMAVLLTGFCNILHDPLHSYRDDARLLKVAVGLMEHILSFNMSEKEASNIKDMADLVAELSWLAEFAIRKVRHELDMGPIYYT